MLELLLRLLDEVDEKVGLLVIGFDIIELAHDVELESIGAFA